MSHLLAAKQPFSFLLFGASGHLAQIKIYPALYVLALKKRLPKNYAVVGYARTPMTDAAFQELVATSIRAAMLEVTEAALKDFLGHVHYHSGQYDNTDDFRALEQRLGQIEQGWGDTVRIAYFSVPPSVYDDIAHHLCAAKVHETAAAFRCIVEKPVGSDLKSAEATWAMLTDSFGEKAVYLLDHYLGKEAVRNIYYLRYANPILERLFKNTLIHHVEVTAAESAGIQGRAGYFENTGILRDMVQSHLLEMVALLTMRLREGGEGFKKGRLDALEQMYLPPATHLDDIVLQGQYGKGMIEQKSVAAYLEEDGIQSGSRTNTFVALKLRTRISRWDGVPFVLRTGKRLPRKETRISIQFQAPWEIGEGSTPNRLDIILQGEAGMRVHLQTKLGGSSPAFRPLVLEDPLVCYGDCLPEHGMLLLEAITGNDQWFLSFPEVRAAWKLLDPIQAHLDRSDTALSVYPSGTFGPHESDAWAARDGVVWVNG